MELVQEGHAGGRLKKLIDFLLYTLEQGPVEKGIIEQALQTGRSIPKKIQNAPDFPLGLDLFYFAWEDLGTCRMSGFGMGPIPWIAINNYCLTYEIEGEQREDMFYHVGRLDDAYLKHLDKK